VSVFEFTKEAQSHQKDQQQKGVVGGKSKSAAWNFHNDGGAGQQQFAVGGWSKYFA
jgi:hypothetical protein